MGNFKKLAALAASLLLLATPAAGQTFACEHPSAVDGDTLRCAGRANVRLEGIDAPERRQAWGPESREALATLIRPFERLVCIQTGIDCYCRTLATCRAGSTDVADWMVRNGHAWNFTRFGGTHAMAEAEARALGLGLWAEPGAVNPGQWRAEQRRGTTASGRCPCR